MRYVAAISIECVLIVKIKKSSVIFWYSEYKV